MKSVIGWNRGNFNGQGRNCRSQGNETLDDGKQLFHIFHVKVSLQVVTDVFKLRFSTYAAALPKICQLTSTWKIGGVPL